MIIFNPYSLDLFQRCGSHSSSRRNERVKAMRYNGKWSFMSTESGTNKSLNDSRILDANLFLEKYEAEEKENQTFDNP